MSEGVDVVVVAYRSPDLLDACLSPPGQVSEVPVVDNSSDPAVHEVADAHGARYLDPKRNLGFAAGVNLGLEHLPRPRNDILLLNPDATIDPAGGAELHRFLHTRHALAGGGAPPRSLPPRHDLAAVAPAQVDDSGRAARVGWPFPTPAGAWLEAA